ncbi:MAG: diguanylate cyclase [Planctomycetota bacterium]
MIKTKTKVSIRVLLIEDSDIDAAFVTRLLKSNPELNFEIDRAYRLDDALEKLETSDYDITMLDLCLPDADELESFQQIRALDARIPIVVFTGVEDEELALRAIESGAQDFMAKGHVTGQMLFRALRFAIARQRSVMGFQAAADSDPLTGMPNRRHLQAKFAELLEQCSSEGQPMSMALFDVDHFKRVNDEHGHFIGDAVLQEIAGVLTGAIRDDMLAARFGGEEFALLMPGHGLEEACKTIEQVLRRLSSTPMKFDDLKIPVTASAGVVEVRETDNWDQCYVACDVALYEAKTSGRNRLVSRRYAETATAQI